MISLSARFFSLVLVLLAIGAFDLGSVVHNGAASDGIAWNVPVFGGVAALPVTSDRRRSTKPRIGVVLTAGQSPSELGHTSSQNSIEVQGQNQSGANASSFESGHGRVGMTMPLKRLESRGGNPLMLLQHHINRANAKLAVMRKRAPIPEEILKQALEKRKLSILSRRSVALPDGGGASPVLAARSVKHKTASSSGLGKRLNLKHGRQGYTKTAASKSAGNKRLLNGILGDVLGGDGSSASSLQSPTAAASANIASPTPSAESKRSKSAASTTASAKKSKSTATKSAQTVDMSAGYPQLDLEASSSNSLTSATEPKVVQSLGLDIEANDVGYVVTVQMGSNKLPFKMLVDSGSADTWVASTVCGNCGTKHQRLGKSTSNTFTGISTKFSITYGTGNVEGHLARDDLIIAGMTLANHTIGLAKSESKDFSDDSVPFDGLMGLAKQQLSNSRQPTPIDSLYSQGLVKAPVMGYRLGRVADGHNDGEVTFGGVDAEKYEGSLTEIENVSGQGFWEAPIDKVSFGGKDLGMSGRTAILDTGTSLIVAPKADADALHAAIPGSRSDGQGGYYIPCTTSESVALTFGGKTFTIDPRDMIFLPVDANNLKGDCVSSVSSGSVGQDNEWLVGATFLKNVYFATNAKTNTIGLGSLAK
ncbi:acid protease [Violaceomyces palustris]|uniref:Acid protease n=1 Tax=Violaceomyces palustris TaxID=1673888 RepID=A0ACD0P0V1_9BASI|nr:acid protease [Violaceomyces palustris]